jgi:hypothetical protein
MLAAAHLSKRWELATVSGSATFGPKLKYFSSYQLAKS